MKHRLSAGCRRLFLFGLLSLAVCALVNPGNFGILDTTRRLQVARWIRLGEPPVRPADAGFGITGKNGERHAWYGIGQSLVLVPFDAVVSATVVPRLGRYRLDSVKQQQIVELLIAFLMQSFITACTLALAYEVLVSFQFPNGVSMAGALALLFGTQNLQYVQRAAENNLLLLLALGALYAVRRWQNGRGARWAAIAGGACGFAILVRLPSLLETAVLLLFALSLAGNRKQLLAAYLPPVAAALVFDRWYHWHRFGELFSTYMGIFGRQFRPAGAPTTFPFSYPFWKGFWGTLFSPDKSVFLFDPLLVVLLLVAAWKWRSIRSEVRRAILWLTVLLLGYTAFYASYADFGGDVAWGHRFVTLPVQLLCLFAVPLLLTFSGALPRLLRRTAWAAVCAALVLQAASTTLAPNLEVIQRDRGFGHGVIVNRAVNLVEIARNRENGSRFAGVPAEWRSLYYFPFQLRFRFGQLAAWAIGLWMALLAALPLLVFATLRSARPAAGR
ncbi:MAG: hypothetical protein LAP87_08815 [Acidobacteriia bacterium]|nr:hypothetical protein [Terriglobia bacterium]